MDRPDTVPEAVWKTHLDWLNVTGETSHRHIRELHRGELGRRYQNHESEAEPARTSEAQSSIEGS